MEVECRRVLARFLSTFGSTSAWWYPILPDVKNNLSSFLGLDYHLRYIPLLCKCGLAKEKMGNNGIKSYIVCQTTSQKGGYSWNSFFVEYNLRDYELTNCYIKQYNKQIYFLRIGVFNKDPFTPIDQYRWNLPLPGRKWLRQKTNKFLMETSIHTTFGCRE